MPPTKKHFFLLLSVRSDGEKTTKNRKIKPQKTRGFNVKNPSNAKGKNHRRQPARTLLYWVCVLQRLAAAYKRNNELWSKP